MQAAIYKEFTRTVTVEAMTSTKAKYKAFQELEKEFGVNRFFVTKLEGKLVRKPQPRTSCTTVVNKIDGAKKFETSFELHYKNEKGEMIVHHETFTQETPAVKVAKELAIEHQENVKLICSKRWTNSLNGDACSKEISPRNPKTGKWELTFSGVYKEDPVLKSRKKIK